MRADRDTSKTRIRVLVAVGVAGLVAVLLVPGPKFEPFHAPPDTTRVFRLPPVDSAAGPMPVDGGAAVTAPRLLNLDEMLAYVGNSRAVNAQRDWARDTVVLQ